MAFNQATDAENELLDQRVNGLTGQRINGTYKCQPKSKRWIIRER
jgi:hypothetical protein